MTKMVLVTAALGLLALASGAEAEAESPGKAVYLQYCGACHGPDGKGDGVAGTFMTPKPADLTQIAKKNGGEFPFQRTMSDIDGRNTVRAHGDPAMPVWGEIFHQQATWDTSRRIEVQGKLMLITDYLRSIQQQ